LAGRRPASLRARFHFMVVFELAVAAIMTAQYARWVPGGKRFLRFLVVPLRMLAAFLLGWLAGFWKNGWKQR
ncbi:MAG: hypothetical protein H0U76_06035, partial [Ktedonobacteraceae bacterium]|nr:hypothetical protein [Ktedonobacteraceae bacterium]